jgi:hypothetical protein
LVVTPLRRSLLVSPEILSCGPSDFSTDWTAARHSVDIEDNIEDAIKAATSRAQTREQCFQEWTTLMQNYSAEEHRQTERRLQMMSDIGMQTLVQVLDQRFPLAHSHTTFLSDPSLGTPQGEMCQMFYPDHDAAGVNINVHFVPGEYDQTPTMNRFGFQGPFVDESAPVTTAQQLPLGNWPSSGNAHDFVGNGSLYPEPCQTGHSFILSGNQPDSGYSGRELSSFQRDLPGWNLEDPHDFVRNGSHYPEPLTQGIGHPSNSFVSPGGPSNFVRHPSFDSGFFGSELSGYQGDLSSLNCPSSVNPDDLLGHGPQRPQQFWPDTGQPGHSSTPSSGFQDSGSQPSPESGYSGSEVSNYQGGNYR